MKVLEHSKLQEDLTEDQDLKEIDTVHAITSCNFNCRNITQQLLFLKAQDSYSKMKHLTLNNMRHSPYIIPQDF